MIRRKTFKKSASNIPAKSFENVIQAIISLGREIFQNWILNVVN